MINIENRERFIPTEKEWGELYALWFKKLTKSIARSASWTTAEDAVQEAFLKVMGLSRTLHLSKELTARTADEWYSFVLWQSRGVLSNMRAKSARFCALDERIGYPPAIWGRKRGYIRHVMRAAVWKACRKSRDPELQYKAFVMFELDNCSAKEVVEALPEVRNANNLYQMSNRIRSELKLEACRQGSALGELRCA